MDSIRGQGAFRRVLRAIELLTEFDNTIDIAVGVLPQNFNDLEKNLLELIQSFRSDKITVRLDDNMKVEGRAVNLHPSMLHLNSALGNDLFNLRIQLHKAGVTSGIDTLHIRTNNCGIGRIPTIDANGDIYPCPIPNVVFGNVRRDDIESVFSRIFLLDQELQIDNIPGCSKCEIKYICDGGCRIENLRRNQSYLLPFCGTERKEKIYSRMIHSHYLEKAK